MKNNYGVLQDCVRLLGIFLYPILFVFLLATLAQTTGCHKEDKTDSPGNTTSVMDPLAQDDTDKALNEPSIQEYSVGVAKNKGILWKPSADSGGKLVILLATSWGKPSVQLWTVDKKTVIDTGRFVYFSNPNRATYRFNYSGAQLQKTYKQGVLLVIGGKIIAKVSKPAGRFE